MNNKEILANAPEGATHVDYNGFYLRAGKSGYMTMEDYDDGRDWDYEHADICHTRSLADIKRIVELEAQTQWISVEDRLPDEKRDYLVYTPKSTYYKIGSNAWHGKLGWATAKNVTHWMPLPTPPSGGEL